MIDSQNHIELDGVRYRLAQDAQGQHHNVRGEPLRPPNAVTVQGESQQKFQMRPDTLLWTWTDWSGGEGRRKLKFGESDRAWELSSVRAFAEPGHLIPGYHVGITQDNTGASDLALSLTLVQGIQSLYGLDQNAANVYKWDDSLNKWGAATALTGVTNGAGPHAVGDDDNIYWIERSTNDVWSWDGSAAPTKISDTLITAFGYNGMAQTDDYIYVYRPKTGKVWEIAKTGATGIELDSWTETGILRRAPLVSLNGKVYALISQRHQTMIREITPTSAAGEGFGYEIARIEGFMGMSIWAHSGSLFILGKHEDDDDSLERTILYLVPGGEYGSLGSIRPDIALGREIGGTGRMLDHFWVQQKVGTDWPNHCLFQIDSVSGGIAMLGYDDVGDATGEYPGSIATFQGDIFWSTHEDATVKRTMRASSNRYSKDAQAVSPEHDFDLVGEKYLGSLVLGCEPLPADWTLYVDYQTDGSGTWTTGITYTTDGGTGTEVAISTDASTVEFRRLQLRVRFDYTGAGNPTTAPVVTGIEARAASAKKVNVFDLLVDLSDDKGGSYQSRSGASKADSILATCRKDTVLDFKDGYTHRDSGQYDQYDVTVDAFNVILSKPGEGVAAVTLREVV